MGKGYTRPGLLGQQIHYDEHGNKIGESWPGLCGMKHYDDHGNYIGETMGAGLSGYRTVDAQGNEVMRSTLSWDGSLTHRDTTDRTVGHTSTGFFGHHSDFQDSFRPSDQEPLFAEPRGPFDPEFFEMEE